MKKLFLFLASMLVFASCQKIQDQIITQHLIGKFSNDEISIELTQSGKATIHDKVYGLILNGQTEIVGKYEIEGNFIYFTSGTLSKRISIKGFNSISIDDIMMQSQVLQRE